MGVFCQVLSTTGEPSPTAKDATAARITPLDRMRQAMTKIDCASLRTHVEPQGVGVVSGSVPDAEQRLKLFRLAAQLVPDNPPLIDVDIVPPPICRSLSVLEALLPAGLVANTSLDLKLADGSNELHQGDAIKVAVRGPGYPAQLHIDYFSLNGQVLHMWPTGTEPSASVGATGIRVFWDAGGSKTWDAGGAPFGTEMIAATATAAPLELGSRQQVEPAVDYVRDLRRALEHSPAGRLTPNALAILFVKTEPR